MSTGDPNWPYQFIVSRADYERLLRIEKAARKLMEFISADTKPFDPKRWPNRITVWPVDHDGSGIHEGEDEAALELHNALAEGVS